MAEDYSQSDFIGPEKEPEIPHYYGDTVRKIFLGIGLLLLIGLPFFYSNVSINGLVLVLGILLVNIFAGLTNPRQKFTILFDIVFSALGLIFFELVGIFRFRYLNDTDAYFWFNQVLTLLFFLALYFSIKTARGLSPS